MHGNGLYWTDPIQAVSGLVYSVAKPVRLIDDTPSDQALLELVYNELHSLVSSCLRQERPGHTLQTSALVNEAYLRLRNASSMHFEDRQHCIRIASRAMRRVLVDTPASAAGRSAKPESVSRSIASLSSANLTWKNI